VAALAAPRPVSLIDPVDPMKRVVRTADAAAVYRIASNVTLA
jgi:hypothetical protein